MKKYRHYLEGISIITIISLFILTGKYIDAKEKNEAIFENYPQLVLILIPLILIILMFLTGWLINDIRKYNKQARIN